MPLVAGAFAWQVYVGNNPGENKSLNAYFMTFYLSEWLGLDLPALRPDFYAFMRYLTPVLETADCTIRQNRGRERDEKWRRRRSR